MAENSQNGECQGVSLFPDIPQYRSGGQTA